MWGGRVALLRLLGCVNSIMLSDDISEISIIKHRSNLLPRYFRLRADALRRDEMPPHQLDELRFTNFVGIGSPMASGV